MSNSVLINDNVEAQVSENTLKSITNQTNVNAQTRAQIGVGETPVFIEPFGDYIYVANYGHIDDKNATISVIDTRNNIVNDTITVGENPSYIETFGDYMYVANSGSDTISVIDTRNNTVVDTITVGGNPSFVFASPPTEFGEYIYVANSGSISFAKLNGTVSVIERRNNTVVDTITVGEYPRFITDLGLGELYVANSGFQTNGDNGTISVIWRFNNTVIDTITVGKNPSFISAPKTGFILYVANSGFQTNGNNGTISVIDTRNNNTLIDTITVGKNPRYIERYNDYIYVANTLSNTISVIDATSNTMVKNIPVGEYPTFIEIYGDAIYVANSRSNTVSLVDPLTNEEVAAMKFDIKPFGAGQIICDGLDAPVNRFLYVTSGAKCIAKPNTGFEFSSWTQNLPRNTSVTINASTTSDWLVDPVAALNDVFTDDPAATLTVNRFGNFTTYFRALPPPVPAEFTFSLITVVVTALVGSLLIPATLSWHKSKKQTSRLNSFHQQMALVYSDGKLDENDITRLDKLNKNILDSYSAGKITNDQYSSLKNGISAAYQKIFKKRIESIADPDTEAVNNIKNDLEDAYSDRKITELDYNLLNGKILRILDKK